MAGLFTAPALTAGPVVLVYLPPERATSETVQISVDSAGRDAQASAYALAVSADGAVAAFASQSPNLGPADPGEFTVYVRRLATKRTTAIGPGNSAALSADGRRIAVGLGPVYVADTATSARLPLCWPAEQAVEVEDVAMSADGNVIAFGTRASLHPADAGGGFDVYSCDLRTRVLRWISYPGNGVLSNGESGSFTFRRPGGPSEAYNAAQLAVSDDGTKIAFASLATNLGTPAGADANPGCEAWTEAAGTWGPSSCPDIYVADLYAETLKLASVDQAGVQPSGGAMSPSFAGDGVTLAYVASAPNLVAGGAAAKGSDVYVFLKNVKTGRHEVASSGPVLHQSQAPLAWPRAVDEAQAVYDPWRTSITANGRYILAGALIERATGRAVYRTTYTDTRGRTVTGSVRALSRNGALLVVDGQVTDPDFPDLGTEQVFVREFALEDTVHAADEANGVGVQTTRTVPETITMPGNTSAAKTSREAVVERLDLFVEGTITSPHNWLSDAVCSSQNGGPYLRTWPGKNADFHKLLVDGKVADWQPATAADANGCDVNHRYRLTVEVERTDTVSFRLGGPIYGDAKGALTVTIHRT